MTFGKRVIIEARARLGLGAQHFAALLGVHPTTVYRWEASATGFCKVEPMQAQMLTLISAHLDALTTAQRGALGVRVAKAIMTKGAMYGLYVMMGDIYD